MTRLAGECPNCKAPLAVVVGRKSTCRSVACPCGATYDYSCWVTKKTPDRTFHQLVLIQWEKP